MPKLTLSVDREIIDKAKELAKQQRTSVSALFAQFINAAMQRLGRSLRRQDGSTAL
jgi:hypothetical protein